MFYSLHQVFVILLESYLGLLFLFLRERWNYCQQFFFSYLDLVAEWLVMVPGAFHPHSCCVSNAEPRLQHLSPVSCFCSFRWVRIITSLRYSQLPLKSRELIESQIANRRTALFHVGLNTMKLVQCDIHFKPRYYDQTHLLW